LVSATPALVVVFFFLEAARVTSLVALVVPSRLLEVRALATTRTALAVVSIFQVVLLLAELAAFSR
jgi:hypothetical protein